MSDDSNGVAGAVLEAVSDGVVAFDLSGKITLMNMAAEQMLGISRAEMIGRTSEALSGSFGPSAQKWVRLIENVLESPDKQGQQRPGEQFELDHKTILVEVHSMVNNERLAGLIAVLRDITEVNELEQARLDFISSTLDELRRPLASISVGAQLGEQVDTLDEARKVVEVIISSANQMQQMLDNILRPTRPAGRLKFIEQPCGLKELVDRAVDHLEGAAISKSITIEFNYSDNHCWILGHEEWLYRMILNLVGNAVKVSSKNETIKIILSIDDPDIQLRIQDRGPGIAEEDLPHLFGKWLRVDDPKKLEGADFQLSLVKVIAEAHGGTVVAQNLPTGGTEVIVLLPTSLLIAPV